MFVGKNRHFPWIKFPRNSQPKISPRKSLKFKKLHRFRNVNSAVIDFNKLKTFSFRLSAPNDPYSKAHTPSPTRPTFSEALKKSVSRDGSPLPVASASPLPASTVDEQPQTSIATNASADIKPAEISVISLSTKEPAELEPPPTQSNKRSHVDDPSESIYTSEIDEQLSPSKRTRRSLSSQESIETFSEQISTTESVSTRRNTHLTYEDIAINDILIVTWGSHGTKQYPARCLEKNDDKKELFIHYNGWNSRHDEWIKLDRVIERKDSANGSSSCQQRPRRTSQISTNRQPQSDINNSVEQISADDDEPTKSNKSHVTDKTKTEESDVDDNSQGQNESTSFSKNKNKFDCFVRICRLESSRNNFIG